MRAEMPPIAVAAGLIEFGGAVIIAVAVFRSLLELVRGGSIGAARLLVVDGSLSALGFKTAATLLKTIELGTWHGVAIFAAILTLRTVIKHLFVWERARLLAGNRMPRLVSPTSSEG